LAHGRPEESFTASERSAVRDRETGDVTLVVETPKGSHNKYNRAQAMTDFRLGSSVHFAIGMQLLFAKPGETPILSGNDTGVCVLTTVMPAIDPGSILCSPPMRRAA
jgi:hypothetical protein